MERAQTNLQLYRRMAALGYREDDLLRVARAYDLAVQLFADVYRGSRKPFVCHLIGTAALVAEERAPIDIVVACASHAAYEHARWPDQAQGSTPDHRREVARVIGTEAEQIVFAYWHMNWNEHVIAALPTQASSLDAAQRALAMMRIANAADEIADLGLRLSAKGSEPRYQSGNIAAMVEAARTLGLSVLAEFIRAAFDENERSTVPVSLKSHIRHSAPVSAAL
jgi:hypothetical protein